MFVGVLCGDESVRGLHHGLVSDIRQAGGNSELLGAASTFEGFLFDDHNPAIRPILEILQFR